MFNFITKLARYIVRDEIAELQGMLEDLRYSREFFCKNYKNALKENDELRAKIRSIDTKIDLLHKKHPLALHASQMVRLLSKLDSKDEDIQNEVLRAYRETIRNELYYDVQSELAVKPQTD